ncbi:hypothetical protein O6P43_019230 [Quillaja saponaria]|uniref:Uncharacterized protein n=1 Tax=Quillaja saponaria TaxID=32244 RepID=A0AAD7LK46_QUISA|nr:hypothetical protein O6P43_019230 [Quillaja saponaria]
MSWWQMTNSTYCMYKLHMMVTGLAWLIAQRISLEKEKKNYVRVKSAKAQTLTSTRRRFLSKYSVLPHLRHEEYTTDQNS